MDNRGISFQKLLGSMVWHLSCDDLDGYAVGPDFSWGWMNGQTKVLQEVLADVHTFSNGLLYVAVLNYE